MQQHRTYGPRDEVDRHDGDRQFLAVNLSLAPDELPPGLLADAENVRMSSGVVEPRKGVTKPGWCNVTSALVDNGIRPVARHYGAGVFKDPDSFEWVMLAADGAIYRCKESNARHEMGLPTGVKILGGVTFCQAFNKLYCFRGRYLAPLVLPSIDDNWQDIVPHFDGTAAYDAEVVATGQVAEEISYGPFQSVTSLTSVGDKATVVTASAHGYITGADVTIQGAAQAEYNGRFNITVVDETTFTFQFVGSATTPATGTITCSNMSRYYRALGSRVTLTGLTWAGSVVTATKTAHGFSNGQYVTIAGATPTGYNGTFVIVNAAADTFQYALASDPGTITVLPTARTSIVLAGQSPDTNAEAWQRIYDVLPNADNALFINNRMLVPTAYTPGVDGYDSTASTYTKKDFIVATSFQDDVHFDFRDEFRINQGSDDEIVDLVKYDNDTVLVFKERSWGILSNVRFDLANVQLDMRGQRYGLCARGAVAVAGKDVYFMATQRGVCSLRQTDLGLIQSVDTPFSNDVEPWIRRINWSLKNLIRLAWWDNKLFVAVPMDDCSVDAGIELGDNLVSGNYTDILGYPLVNVPLTAGQTYKYTAGNEDYARTLLPPNGVGITPGTFVVPAGQMLLVKIGGAGTLASAWVQTSTPTRIQATNNAILVHDFRNLGKVRQLLGDDAQAWACRDVGVAISPQEFILSNVAGRERLLFTSADGYVNLYEQSTAGDEVQDPTRENQLGWAEVATLAQTRGYTHDELMPKKFPFVELSLSVWNARFSITAQTGQSRAVQALVTGREFARTKYLRPFDRAPWDETNANDDFAEPHRGNYSVELNRFYCGTELSLSKYYDVFARWSTRPLMSGYVQFTLTNDQGRCVLRGVSPAAVSGPRRKGVLV